MRRKVWDNADINLPLVVKDTSWHFLHDFSRFSSCRGVFIFANSGHQVKYVGHTINRCIVESIADAIAEKKDDNATLVKVLYTQSPKDAMLIANVLMEKYTPVNNNQPNGNDKPIITGTSNIR